MLLCLMLAGCASVEADRTSFDLTTLARTRVDYSPLNRLDRDRLLEFEKVSLEQNTAPLQKEFDQVSADRLRRYEEIKGKYPDCERQKHCLSALAFGNEKEFERYNDLNRSLQVYDRKLIDLESELRAWKARYDLRSRAIYNRFLAYELLQLGQADKRIVKMAVHSLEAFDTRRALSERLLRSTGLQPASWGDLNFTMFGQPVDEAATVATFSVSLLKMVDGKTATDDFLVVFLLNARQFDNLEYDKGLLQYWAAKLVEPKQLEFRKFALCSTYAIGGDTLVTRLPAASAEVCAPIRTKLQAKFRPGQEPAEAWALPLGYFKSSAASDR